MIPAKFLPHTKEAAEELLSGFVKNVNAFNESLKGFEAYIDSAFHPPKIGPTCWCSFCGASDLERDFLVHAPASPLAPADEVRANEPLICDSCVNAAARLIEEGHINAERSSNWHEDGDGDCG